MKKHFPLKAFLIFIVLNSAFAFQGSTSPRYNGVSISATADEAIAAWGFSDPGSYLQVGYSLATKGVITEDLRWAKVLWPPGIPTLHALSVKMVGLEGSFIAPLVVIHVLMWSLALAFVAVALRGYFNWQISLLVPLSLFATSLYRDFLLGTAVVYSDSITAACLLLSIASAVLASRRRNPFLLLAVSALGVTSAAYFRGQYFPVVQALFVIGILLVALYVPKRILSNSSASPKLKVLLEKVINLRSWQVLFVGAISLLLCAPNLIAREQQFGDISWDLSGRYHWTSTSALVAMGNWFTEDQLAGFAADGGAATACKVDRKRCGEIHREESASESPFSIYDDEPYTAREYQSMVLRTFVKHPIEWARVKLPYFFSHWYSEPRVSSPSGTQFFLGSWTLIGILCLALYALTELVRSRDTRTSALLALLVLGATLMPPYVAHYEVRYLVLPKVLGFLAANLILLRLNERIWRRKSQGA